MRILQAALPGIELDDVLIASESGREIYRFNSSGRHLSTLDALTGSVRHHFKYDSQGLLMSIEDSDGILATIERDVAGNPTAIVGRTGTRNELAVDDGGYLSSITNPAGAAVQLTYSPEGMLTSLQEPRGGIHRFSYDNQGRLLRYEDPTGGYQDLVRSDTDEGYTVALLHSSLREETYSVEELASGEERRVISCCGGIKVEGLLRTDGSRVAVFSDGTELHVEQAPDPRWGLQAPLPKSVTVTTPGGLKAVLTVKSNAELTDPSNPIILTTEIVEVALNGHTDKTEYDAALRQYTTTTPEGRQIVAKLDSRGRTTEERVAGLHPMGYSYDDRGRLSRVTHGERIWTYSYNEEDRLVRITDPLSMDTGFAYDVAGRVTKQMLRDGREIAYDYDENGNIVSITPPGTPSHSFGYTLMNRTSEYMPPSVGTDVTTTQYSYGSDGQLASIIRPDNETIELQYDDGGRLQATILPTGESVSYKYEATIGNTTEVIAADGEKVSYAYDGSLPIQESWDGTISGNVGWAYDNDLRVKSVSVNQGLVATYQYDSDGLLIRAGDLSLSRDSDTGLQTATSLGSLKTQQRHDLYGEPSEFTAIYGTTALLMTRYLRDELGRIVEKTETLFGQTTTYQYLYDLAGRLSKVTKDGSRVAQYEYDHNGNRVSCTGENGPAVDCEYDAQDRLLRYGDVLCTYAPNGELVSKAAGSWSTTLNYDVLGNLKGVTLPDGQLISYLVDGNNRRIGKQVNGTLVQAFLYDGQLAPVAELDAAGNVVSHFVYATWPTVPDYMVRNGATFGIIADHLGSPRLVVDVATGEIVQRMNYDALGNVILDTNPGFQPFGFAGGLYDRDTGLVRFGARDYDAYSGRWTAKDPVRFAGGPNLYTYADNDPINFSDIFGLGPDIHNIPNPATNPQRFEEGVAHRIKKLYKTVERLPTHWHEVEKNLSRLQKAIQTAEMAGNSELARQLKDLEARLLQLLERTKWRYLHPKLLRLLERAGKLPGLPCLDWMFIDPVVACTAGLQEFCPSGRYTGA